MNYDELSVEERIQKASEYAVILTADERPDFDIIRELKETFNLDEEQAKQAYNLMRKNYNAEFRAGIKSKIRNALVAIFLAICLCVFYATMAGEIGWPFLLLVLLFGGGMVQAILNIAKWYRERSGDTADDSLPENERRANAKQKEKDDLVTGIPVMLLFLAILTFFFFYKKNRVKNLNEITVVKRLVVDDNVASKSTSGKHPTYYLLFAFKGYNYGFRFEDNMYKYGKWDISKNDFKIGDTLNIEIATKEVEEIDDTYDNHTIYILNVFQKGSWLIDQEDRNRRVEKENKNAFIGLLVAFVVSCISSFLWIRYRTKKKSILL